MKSTFVILVSLFIILQQASAKDIRVRILHWNDFHSQNIPFKVKSKSLSTLLDTTYYVGGSAVLKSYLTKYSDSTDILLILNAGDDFQGTPISTITRGRSQIELMNLLHPDAMTLGNHEFDYGKDSLAFFLQQAAFPVISANLVDKIRHVTFVPPYVIKEIDSIKFGIIGMITPDLGTSTLPDNIKGLTVAPTESTVREIISSLRKQKISVIIILSHMGFEQDSLLALQIPDIDVIIGGHSHTVLSEPRKVNHTVIGQAGTRGRYLGIIDGTISTVNKMFTVTAGRLIETRSADVVPDSLIARKVDEFEKAVGTSLSTVIGTLTTDWEKSFTKECNIGNWQADIMRAYAKTDIALQNSGGIRKDLLAGPITARDIWEINPFGNEFLKFSVTGADLLKVFRWQAMQKGELCQVSGVRYSVTVHGRSRDLKNISINGKPLIPAQTYSIVTNNYVVSRAMDLLGIDIPAAIVIPLNILDRDLFIEKIKEIKTITSSLEGRIIEVKE